MEKKAKIDAVPHAILKVRLLQMGRVVGGQVTEQSDEFAKVPFDITHGDKMSVVSVIFPSLYREPDRLVVRGVNTDKDWYIFHQVYHNKTRAQKIIGVLADTLREINRSI